MAKANTYKAERMLGPYGFSVTDVLITEGNKKRPVTFKIVGETIDLEKTDIKTFVKSSMTGQLHRLHIGGALSSVQVDVSERVFNEIQTALAEYGLSNYQENHTPPKVKHVVLEPGVMVAVGNFPEPDQQMPAPAEFVQEPPSTKLLEPGVLAPGAVVQEQAVIAEEKIKSKKRSSKKIEVEAEEPAVGESKYSKWNFNIDFQNQKRMILETGDVEFLKWVAENDDRVQFQKLAQTKLADLVSK